MSDTPSAHTAERLPVILIEDDPATQDHLARVLSSSPRLELLGCASTASEAYSLLFMTAPRVALIDLGLPDFSGIDIIRWISKNKPDIETLVITAFGDEDHVIRSLEAGASGYLLKDYSSEELENHILEVAHGGSPISPLIARQLLFRLQKPVQQSIGPSAHVSEAARHNLITDRELMVIQQVSKGFTVQEIARQMGISNHTVATHVKRIYKKLHVHSRSEAVYEASLLGLLDL
ncbi:MAG TPA: response regulator transcription factor [Limnobacter sp.]|uniref:response regulator transcription factor n=1 Tax=Limnobacter sp. TaxID=2003368 RepID=UPI002EDA9150